MRSAAVIACAALIMSSPTFAMTEDDCKAAWTKADVNGDNVLTDAEATRYLASVRIANGSVADTTRITDAEYMALCKADVFATAAPEEGAPFAGANSFTEAQAKDRIAASGYLNVSALMLDPEGIWRGNAELDGKPVRIAVDYKGNVVAN
ncbi:MAG: hypothetical protein R3D57_02700 [Hyphomicrobiaceae bacterium]